MVLRRLFVALLLVLAMTEAGAEIYKCTDASGKIQYSDRSCGTGSAVINPRAAAAKDEDSERRMEKTRRLLRAYEEERREERRQQAEQQAREEEQKRNCAQAKIRYRQITEANRVFRVDEEGNRVILSDEERAESTARARQAVEQWCG